jgi:hypothetical protein
VGWPTSPSTQRRRVRLELYATTQTSTRAGTVMRSRVAVHGLRAATWKGSTATPQRCSPAPQPSNCARSGIPLSSNGVQRFGAGRTSDVVPYLDFCRHSPVAPSVTVTLPRCAVVTPARDEAHNRPRLGGCLAAQRHAPDAWVIVENVLTDDTGSTVRVPSPAAPARGADGLGRARRGQGEHARSADAGRSSTPVQSPPSRGFRDGPGWRSRLAQRRASHDGGCRPWYLVLRALFQMRRDPMAVGLALGDWSAAGRRDPPLPRSASSAVCPRAAASAAPSEAGAGGDRATRVSRYRPGGSTDSDFGTRGARMSALPSRPG